MAGKQSRIEFVIDIDFIQKHLLDVAHCLRANHKVSAQTSKRALPASKGKSATCGLKGAPGVGASQTERSAGRTGQCYTDDAARAKLKIIPTD